MKKSWFQVVAPTSVGLDKYTKGSTVELEVDEEGQPVVQILRGRVRPTAKPRGDVSQSASDSSAVADAEAEAQRIIDEAHEKAKSIEAEAKKDANQLLDEAEAQAKGIISDAQADAKKIVDAAGNGKNK